MTRMTTVAPQATCRRRGGCAAMTRKTRDPMEAVTSLHRADDATGPTIPMTTCLRRGDKFPAEATLAWTMGAMR